MLYPRQPELDRSPSKPGKEDLIELPIEVRALSENVIELRLVQAEKSDIGLGDHGGVAWFVQPKSDLAEELPLPELGDLAGAVAAVAYHRHLALSNHVELVAGFSLSDDGRPAREALVAHRIGDCQVKLR